MSMFELERLFKDLLRRVHLLEVTQPMGYSSVSEGRSRFAGNESVLVEGSGKVEGWWIVTGTQRVTGRLEGSGALDWTGPWFLRGPGEITGALTGTGQLIWAGPWDLRGNGLIKGNVDITGALDVKSRLTLGPNGYIESGTVRIDRGGNYGGRISSSGAVLELLASGSVVISAESFVARNGSFRDLSAIGTVSANIKNFRIPHPLKPDHFLLHGSTESPVSGVEYWGDATLPETGQLTVILPDYFEALTKPNGRVPLVAARGFVADWGDVEDGCFTVSGKPGGRFSWLVKAERANADFPVEEPVFGPIRE